MISVAIILDHSEYCSVDSHAKLDFRHASDLPDFFLHNQGPPAFQNAQSLRRFKSCDQLIELWGVFSLTFRRDRSFTSI